MELKYHQIGAFDLSDETWFSYLNTELATLIELYVNILDILTSNDVIEKTSMNLNVSKILFQLSFSMIQACFVYILSRPFKQIGKFPFV